MPARMAPHQLEFDRELLAPFHPSELSEVPARGGKKTLTYIDKRALENRLDSVCGPHGWKPEYEATARDYKCRLSILVPAVHPNVTRSTPVGSQTRAPPVQQVPGRPRPNPARNAP